MRWEILFRRHFRRDYSKKGDYSYRAVRKARNMELRSHWRGEKSSCIVGEAVLLAERRVIRGGGTVQESKTPKGGPSLVRRKKELLTVTEG